MKLLSIIIGVNAILILLHSKWPKLNCFDHSQCSRFLIHCNTDCLVSDAPKVTFKSFPPLMIIADSALKLRLRIQELLPDRIACLNSCFHIN